MTDDQIKHLAKRFLQWALPENFNPDGGISFEPVGNKGTPREYKRSPAGTNLFGYTEAVDMARFMVEGLPAAPTPTNVMNAHGLKYALCRALGLDPARVGRVKLEIVPGDPGVIMEVAQYVTADLHPGITEVIQSYTLVPKEGA